MSVLEACHQLLGPTPRTFSPEVTREIRVPYIPLMSAMPFDSLIRVHFDQGKLRERGEVAWARILQANPFLFAPGLNIESHAATVLHLGSDQDDLSLLDEVAARIGGPSGSGREHPDSKARGLLHPTRRKYGVPVPPSLAGGHKVFCSDIQIFRKLLPPQPKGATLQKMVLPVLVAPAETKMLLQLPWRFWPEEFIEFWNS